MTDTLSSIEAVSITDAITRDGHPCWAVDAPSGRGTIIHAPYNNDHGYRYQWAWWCATGASCAGCHASPSRTFDEAVEAMISTCERMAQYHQNAAA